VPGVFEGQQLGIACLARLVAEDDVVVAIGVEGRVELNQVDGSIGWIRVHRTTTTAKLGHIQGRAAQNGQKPRKTYVSV